MYPHNHPSLFVSIIVIAITACIISIIVFKITIGSIGTILLRTQHKVCSRCIDVLDAISINVVAIIGDAITVNGNNIAITVIGIAINDIVAVNDIVCWGKRLLLSWLSFLCLVKQ